MSELAIHGGPAVFPNGPPSWPRPDPEVQASLLAAYRDGSWGRYHGPNGIELAERLRTLHDVEHVRLCSSGTVGVELALRGLGITKGDEVVLAGYDFSGNFRCVEAVGAWPVLIDICDSNGCIDLSGLTAAFGPKVRALVVSHLHSSLAPMPAIMSWASEHRISVVEDACQAPGAVVEGQIAGSWGDVAVLSFGGSKLLTAGRGGAVLTNRPEVFQRMKVFAEPGNDAFPFSELQAAVVVPQLKKLESANQQRQNAVDALLNELEGITSLRYFGNHSDIYRPSYYKVSFICEFEDEECDRAAFLRAAQAEGVAIDAGFRGFVRRGDRRCRRVDDLENSGRASNDLVVLHHPVLLEPVATVRKVAVAIRKVLEALV